MLTIRNSQEDQRWRSRWLCLLGVGIVILTTACTAEPVLCRQLGDRQICLLTIQRSAKHYWEYRASVQIEDQVRPVEIYNCRDRRRTMADGRSQPFEPEGAGELICRTLYSSR